MEVVTNIRSFNKKFPNPVLAIGIFDGFHQGHQALVRKVVKMADQIRGTAMVMTFHPHPVHILRPDIKLPLIVSLPYRLKLIEQAGIGVCIVMRFTKSFSHLSPRDFVNRFLVKKLRVKGVIVGDDFRFGQNRVGDFEEFKLLGKEFGFEVYDIKTTANTGQKTVSSSKIRKYIHEGSLSKAEKLLGRPVSVFGKVVSGDSRGKSLGFPTANINPGQELLLPYGVYLSKVILKNKSYPAMANIGERPSFPKSMPAPNIEVHLFDFHQDIYGQEIVVQFIKKIRNEISFRNEQDLMAQLNKDELTARKLLKLR